MPVTRYVHNQDGSWARNPDGSIRQEVVTGPVPTRPAVRNRDGSISRRPDGSARRQGDDDDNRGDDISDEEQRRRNGESASLANLLTDFGLEALIPIVDRWVRDGISVDEAMLRLRDESTAAGKLFYERFPAIKLRRDAGLAPISPAEYVAYERSAHQVLASAGLPEKFWDSKDDFTDLLALDVSVQELTDRVNEGFVAVSRAPAEVREAFGKFFGPNSDAALASFFLDKDRAMPILREYVQTAGVAGAATQFGFKVSQSRADQIRQTGAGYQEARRGFSELAGVSSLFDETISEREDMAAEREGVSAVFGLDQGQAAKKVEQRLGQRVAAFSGSGGAAGSERGLHGLGTARS